jgi:hypothetical protein
MTRSFMAGGARFIGSDVTTVVAAILPTDEWCHR